MQVNAIFTQGFAVIRNVDHRRADTVFMCFKKIDQLRQEIIGIGNGIVVGIDHFLLAAVLYGGSPALGLKSFECLRIALVIGRAVAALLMQHDDRITVYHL